MRRTIETNGEGGSGKSVLVARHDDIYIYIYIYIYGENNTLIKAPEPGPLDFRVIPNKHCFLQGGVNLTGFRGHIRHILTSINWLDNKAGI